MTIQPQRVRDFMMSSPLTVSPEMEIMRVVHLLVENDISGVPVVDKEGILMGFVTERDCIRVALQAGYFDEIGDSVANYMTTDLRIVHPDDSLMEVGELFADSPFRRCPVVEDSRLIGLICRRDVLRALTAGAWFTHTTLSSS